MQLSTPYIDPMRVVSSTSLSEEPPNFLQHPSPSASAKKTTDSITQNNNSITNLYNSLKQTMKLSIASLGI